MICLEGENHTGVQNIALYEVACQKRWEQEQLNGEGKRAVSQILATIGVL